MLYASEIQPQDVKKIIESIPQPIKNDVMTTYARIQQESEQIGIQKGEQIGIQKNQTEVVLALHADNIPIDRIAKYTNLSEEEVLKILKSLNEEV